MIKAVVREPTVGEKTHGTITRVEPYGVFVNLGNKKTGLCHVKQLGRGFVEDATKLFSVGDPMHVEIA